MGDKKTRVGLVLLQIYDISDKIMKACHCNHATYKVRTAQNYIVLVS